MKITLNREQASQHDVARHYVVNEERMKIKRDKGITDYYIYDDTAKRNPITVKFKKDIKWKASK